MKIAITLSGFTLIVLSFVVGRSDAQILVDDFSDPNLDGWTPVVLRMENMGSEIIDASSGALHLGSTGQTSNASRDSFVGMSWDESIDPIYSNGSIRARFTINESANNFGLYTRVSDDSASWYRFGATSISPIIRGDPGVFVFTKSKDEAITENQLLHFGEPKLNEEWMFEGGMSGNKLSMKWWKVGEPEPTQPLWEWIDNDPLSQGTFGMGTSVDQTGILVTGSPPPWRLGITVDDMSFESLPLLPGDFDGNGQLNEIDLDLQAGAIMRNALVYDLNNDGNTDLEDRRIWVEDMFGTFLGDADLNKKVEFADFLTLANNFSSAGGWSEGDFDGNGQIEFSDFLLLSSNFEKSAAQTAAVPEPNAAMLLLMGAVCCLMRRRICHAQLLGEHAPDLRCKRSTDRRVEVGAAR